MKIVKGPYRQQSYYIAKSYLKIDNVVYVMHIRQLKALYRNQTGSTNH
jgi:hypothetical protein